MSLADKKVLVGLTGGIACYKVPNLVRLLVKQGAVVHVVMTNAAAKFITPLTMETVSNNPVSIEMFPDDRFVGTKHIDLAEWPDLVVIAPATANFMGKMASGVSDDLLTTVMCARSGPVMMAPAMNPNMWHNKVTQRNLTFLRDEMGYMVIDPGEGAMACDDVGVGRMAEPEQIFERVNAFFSSPQKKKSPKTKKS